MDTPETAVHILATVKSFFPKSKETDVARIIRGKGLEKCS